MDNKTQRNNQTNKTILKKTINNLIVVGAVAFGTAVMLSEYFIKKLTNKDEQH